MGHGIASVILVALGGTLGGMARFAISNLMASYLGNTFPWGTLLVNATGALLAGVVLGSFAISDVNTPSLWLFSVGGLLGGYTTVSSFSLQTLELWQSGRTGYAALNIAATLLIGLAMTALGWVLAGGYP